MVLATKIILVDQTLAFWMLLTRHAMECQLVLLTWDHKQWGLGLAHPTWLVPTIWDHSLLVIRVAMEIVRVVATRPR